MAHTAVKESWREGPKSDCGSTAIIKSNAINSMFSMFFGLSKSVPTKYSVTIMKVLVTGGRKLHKPVYKKSVKIVMKIRVFLDTGIYNRIKLITITRIPA